MDNFNKSWDSTAYRIEMDIVGGVCDSECGTWDTKTDAAVFCTGCDGSIISSRRFIWQMVRELMEKSFRVEMK